MRTDTIIINEGTQVLMDNLGLNEFGLMKTPALILTLFVLFGCVSLSAQTKLPDSKHNSSELYVYKASTENLRKIYLKDESPDENMLQTFITSYDRKDKTPSLPRGNYFIVGADGNYMIFNDHTVDDFNFKIVPGEQMMLCLYDSLGNIIRDAEVKYGSSKIKFNKTTNTYNANKEKDEQMIEVNNKGVFHYIKIGKDNSYKYHSKNNIFYKTKSTLIRKWLALKYNVKWLFNRDERPDKNKYTGFIVFSKPKYKPGETVKLKAYMTYLNGEPYNKPVNIRLYNNYYTNKIDTALVKNLSPYRPGMFQYEFQLSDSLNLKLDNDYTVALRTKGMYGKDINNRFRYEEYELKSTRFTIETKKKDYAASDSIKIKFKATDENEMALYGGKVEVKVTPETLGKQGMNKVQSTFIPYVLWTETVDMSDVSEKEITLPDSIFPTGISLGFEVKCTYLSADNEKVVQSKSLFRKSNDYLIDFSLNKGILSVNELYKGEAQPAEAEIEISGENNEAVLTKTVTLPYQLTVPWVASDVYVKTKNASDIFSLEDTKEEQLGYRFYRRNDSIYLKVDNPANIPFWYVIRKNKKEIANGYTTQLQYAVRNNGQDGYGMQLSYLFGKERHIEETLPFVQKNMSINVSTPTTVYPGQTANIVVSVTDKKGKPVENADITAYAFTSKFEDYSMPYFAVKGTARYAKQFINKRYDSDEIGINNQTSYFTWNRWKQTMSLDTIEYYKFLYPKVLYSYEEPSADGTTQIAPYVVIDGALQGVHLLWIDDRLFYVNQAQQLNPYLFSVPPGKHNLRFRTHDREVSVYNVMLKKGTKTILSFDAGIPYIRTDIYENSATSFILVSKLLKKEEQNTFSKEEMDYLSTQLITVDNNFGKLIFPGTGNYLELPAYINTGNTNYYLNFIPRTYYNKTLRTTVNYSILAGPFPYRNLMNGLPDMATVYSDRKPLVSLQIEGGYNYTLFENYQKMKSWGNSPINKGALAFVPDINFKTNLLTEDDIYKNFNQKITDNLTSLTGQIDDKKIYGDNKNNVCRMRLFLGNNKNGSDIKPALILIVPQNKEDIKDYGLYYGGTRDFKNLLEGNMNILLVFGDTTSYTATIALREKGQNYLQLDSIGRDGDNKIAAAAFNLFQRNTTKTFVKNPYLDTQNNTVVDTIPVQLTGIFNRDNAIKGIITGIVVDNYGEPLIGVSVSVKGKSIGTVTDFDGRFELRGASAGDKIEIAFIGFVSTVVDYKEGYDYKIVLKESEMHLDEVVVVGYGTHTTTGISIPATKSESISFIDIDQALQGSIAGLMASSPGVSNALMVRGFSSIDESNAPLIIVNGLPFNGKVEDIDQSTIISINVLKDSSATSVYGSKAANGVIVIRTKASGKGIENNENNELGTIDAGNSMRRNFHDDAFWQPSLKTNKKGEVSFEVTYPDDITSWNAYFLAVGNRKQADKKQMTIQSFKALTARLSTPRFAIRSDSLNAVGRIANHLNDSIEVNETVAVEGKSQERKINMTTSHVEQIPVTVSGGDSIGIAYSLHLPNGYFDGEERFIPIFEQGMLQTYGEFKIINDTVTTTFNVNPDLGAVTLHAETSSLSVFLKEIDKIDNYPYLCNEQMASKIKALLSKKKIAAVLGKEFKEDNKIKTLISKLNNNSNSERLWGWWNKDKTELWMSRQIIDALLNAKKEGYKVNIDSAKICTVLEQQVKDGLAVLPMIALLSAPYAKQELLDRLLLLKKLNAHVDYQSYYEQINQRLKSPSINVRLKEMFLLSSLGLNDKINVDTLMYYSRKTMLGSIYWGDAQENKYSFATLSPVVNDVENTLMAFAILKDIGGHETELGKIRNYFFERRRDGSWQNIYQASRIIETILPDMLNPDTNYSEVSMNINGKKISSFPFTEKIEVNQPIRIKKEGSLPLFITTYQQEWNPNPQPESSKGFAIQTIFKENQDTVSNLKAGKPVNLEVILKLDADADYVQIEVPIPAGCSYDSKNQGFYGKEAYREYFKEKVSIFCNRLAIGEHKFTIGLIPRFTGKYTLNPAKAELMYFPTFYGNEKVKTTEITYLHSNNLSN